jgi:hypothetical protein
VAQYYDITITYYYMYIIYDITDIYCKIRSIHTSKKSKDYYRVNKRCGAIDYSIIKLQNGKISRYIITKS